CFSIRTASRSPRTMTPRRASPIRRSRSHSARAERGPSWQTVSPRRKAAPTRSRSHVRRLPLPLGDAPRIRDELGEFAQADVAIAGEIRSEPAEVPGTEDDYDALVRRLDQLQDVAVDAHVAPEPVGDQVGAGPIPRLSELRFPIVEAHVLGDFVV